MTPMTAGEARHQDNSTAFIQWKTHMQGIKSELLEQMHSQLGDLFDKALDEAAHAFPQPSRNGPVEMQSREKVLLQEKQKKKVFIAQQAPLDELLEVKHFRSLYHMFVAVFCLFAVRKVLVDSIDEGWLALNLNHLFFAFGNMPRLFFAWLCIFLYSLFVPYTFLQMWASSLRSAKYPQLFTATTAVVLLVCNAAVLGFYPIYTVVSYDMGPVCRLFVILEQICLLMKIHSFLRESVPPILYATSKDGKIHPPELETYLYFLLCPTLIYRESYPRTPCVRWRYVIKNFAQVLGTIFYFYFIVEHFCFPLSIYMGQQPFSSKKLVLSIFSAMLPGSFLMLLLFFGLLHSWLNAFAEMLRFADRGFYKDWWNSTSISGFYRTWNVVMHEWFYYYIYRDLLWLLRGKARGVAMLSTFIFSAFLHDYTFSMSFGVFCPVYFMLLSFFGVLFTFIIHDKRTGPIWNVFFWASFCFGQGTQLLLYSQVWYAKINCPLKERIFWGMVSPRCHS